MKLSPKLFFYIMCGVLVLLLGLFTAGAVAGNMLLQKQSSKLTELKIENKALDKENAALIQAKRDIEKYNELDSIAKSIVPQDKDQAKTVREIVNIANINRINIKSIDFETSTLGQAAQKAPASAGSTPAQAAKPTAVPLTQLKAIEGITGVYALEIRIQPSGVVQYDDFVGFLSDLEKSRRTAHVTSISILPDSGGEYIRDFKLTLNAYVKP